MITGCAPFFIIALAGVAAGSWAFGSHLAARLVGVGALALFLLYFALLNWTAQRSVRARLERPEGGEDGPPPEQAHPGGQPPERFTSRDRAEWLRYLRTEGRILWATVAALLLTLVAVGLRR